MAQHSHSRRLSLERPELHMGLLGEGYKHLLVLVVHTDYQLAVVGSHIQDGSVRWFDLAEQAEVGIRQGYKLEWEKTRRLAEEERRLWMGRSSLAVEDTQSQKDLLQGSSANMVVRGGISHRNHHVALPLVGLRYS